MVCLEDKRNKILDALEGLELDLKSKKEFVDILLFNEYDLSRNAFSEDVLYFTNGNGIDGLINLSNKTTIPYLNGIDLLKNYISFGEVDCDIFLNIKDITNNAFARLLDFKSYNCNLITDTGITYNAYSGLLSENNRLYLRGRFNNFPGLNNLPNDVNKLYLEIVSSVKGKSYYIKLIDKTK